MKTAYLILWIEVLLPGASVSHLVHSKGTVSHKVQINNTYLINLVAAVFSKVEGEVRLDSWADAIAHSCQESYPFLSVGPLLGPAPLVTQSDDLTVSKYSLLLLLGMLSRRCQNNNNNRKKGTASYDQERDQLVWLTEEVSSAWLSYQCLAMSCMTEWRGVFVEGGIRLPHSPAVHYLQHFVLSILLVNEVQKVKHADPQKDRKTPEYLS